MEYLLYDLLVRELSRSCDSLTWKVIAHGSAAVSFETYQVWLEAAKRNAFTHDRSARVALTLALFGGYQKDD